MLLQVQNWKGGYVPKMKQGWIRPHVVIVEPQYQLKVDFDFRSDWKKAPKSLWDVEIFEILRSFSPIRVWFQTEPLEGAS